MMNSVQSVTARIDAWIIEVLADWNIYSTVIAIAIVSFVLLTFYFGREPDTHPYILARQGTASIVRNPGESSVYRSLETPYDFPLRAGFTVKDPGAPKWTGGRRGDLRDVWASAVRGARHEYEAQTGKASKIYTVFGRSVTEHGLDDVTQEMNVIGRYIQESKAKTVAVSLTDSVELIAAIFGPSFAYSKLDMRISSAD